MVDYVFGANILENLTTGMYQDSKVVFREYIQNACDQIDKAVRKGLLSPGQGVIDIWLDLSMRSINIQDNATGIPAADFQRILGNIADSDKTIGEDKGFRGIGRLCGLAYCKELVFASSAKGEDVVSFMICDAAKMRTLIEENTRGKKHTANDVLNTINRFEQKSVSEIDLDVDSHFFKVTMLSINRENTDLLNFQQVKDYLSFVAPVPYQSSFYYRKEIYKHAEQLGKHIDEYNIYLDGEPIFKKYNTTLKDPYGNKYDDIFDVHFKDFINSDGELLAWMWVGLSKFQKAIPKINQMRGLRLRKENIQIGGEDALQKLFKEDRGNSYFVGEVFAIDKELIPNSQRDYFNENYVRLEFERELYKYFNEELHKVYYGGSTINSAIKKIDTFEKKEAEFIAKELAGDFVDKDHREREMEAIIQAKAEADTAKIRIERMKNIASEDEMLHKVISRVEIDRPKAPEPPLHLTPSSLLLPKENGNGRRTDRLSQYSKNERKLISKIYSIITTATDGETAEMIIRKIEEGLQGK